MDEVNSSVDGNVSIRFCADIPPSLPQKAPLRHNVITLRKEPSSEMDLALFYKKVEEFLKKGLTKRQKCAGDLISKLIESPLVNSGKIAIDKEKSNDLHPYTLGH